jgi:hypothetical protein
MFLKGFSNENAGCLYCKDNTNDPCCKELRCEASAQQSDNVRKTSLGVVFGVIGVALVAGFIALLIRRRRQRQQQRGYENVGGSSDRDFSSNNEKNGTLTSVPQAYSNSMSTPYSDEKSLNQNTVSVLYFCL